MQIAIEYSLLLHAYADLAVKPPAPPPFRPQHPGSSITNLSMLTRCLLARLAPRPASLGSAWRISSRPATLLQALPRPFSSRVTHRGNTLSSTSVLVKAAAGTAEEAAADFGQLGVGPELLAALEEKFIFTPTEIQVRAAARCWPLCPAQGTERAVRLGPLWGDSCRGPNASGGPLAATMSRK